MQKVQAVATRSPMAARPWTKRVPARSRTLEDPAKLEGSQQATVQVQDLGGDVSLDRYMRLPPEQYSELDPQLISALGGSTFLLKVPRLSLFNVWVEPEVVVSVRLEAGMPAVVFESMECRLHGSDLLSQLGLDRRFVLYFHTLLTWQPNGQAVNGHTSPALSSTSGSSSNGNGAVLAGAGAGTLSAQVEVHVWSEVVGPFRAIPRSLLQATGNAVLRAMMSATLPLFINRLADDYRRWSEDASYRARRAAIPAASAPPPLQH